MTLGAVESSLGAADRWQLPIYGSCRMEDAARPSFSSSHPSAVTFAQLSAFDEAMPPRTQSHPLVPTLMSFPPVSSQLCCAEAGAVQPLEPPEEPSGDHGGNHGGGRVPNADSHGQHG